MTHNPPAFPGKVCIGHEPISGNPIYKHPHGMSLRDYFAGQALIGMMTNCTTRMEHLKTEQVKICWEVAQSMLEIRKEYIND